MRHVRLAIALALIGILAAPAHAAPKDRRKVEAGVRARIARAHPGAYIRLEFDSTPPLEGSLVSTGDEHLVIRPETRNGPRGDVKIRYDTVRSEKRGRGFGARFKKKAEFALAVTILVPIVLFSKITGRDFP